MEILRNIDLFVEQGEFFALLGPSGSGKTTLLRLLAGLDHAQKGEMILGKRLLNELPPWERDVGLVFQGFSLWPHMSVMENIAFGLQERRLDRKDIQYRVESIMELLGLRPLKDFYPHQLSGGQQQRVALARALVIQPKLLLLDEPLSNLEHPLRLQMRRDLRLLQRKLGITMILVTHDQEEALSIADRIAIIRDGEIHQVGTPSALYDFPVSTFVAQSIGMANLIPGKISQEAAHTCSFYSDALGYQRIDSNLIGRREGNAVLCIRPHAIDLFPIDAVRDGCYLWAEGIVESLEFTGNAIFYQIKVGEQLLCISQPHLIGVAATPAGTPVLLALDFAQARIFFGSSEEMAQ
ncbi:MAG: ABC transporter ATP-binding protein [Betaproteobacteria bacterium]